SVLTKTTRGRSPDPPLAATELSFSLAFALRNYFVEFEDRQEHRDNDAADNHTQEHDQHWFDQRGKSIEQGFDFFVPEISHFLEHGIDFTGSFTSRDHAK